MKAPRQSGRRRRIVVIVEDEIIRALKVRAAQESTTVSQLVAAWVRSWTKSQRHG